jgi:osmotically-inducible protein OsmY
VNDALTKENQPMLRTLLVSLALATSLGCATTRPAPVDRTAGEFIDDSAMTASVNSVIVGDADAHFFKIDVTTLKGDVVLQGFVNTRETEARLIARIKQLHGVRSVKSLLRIEQS